MKSSELSESLHHASEKISKNPIANKVLNSNTLIFTFLRSTVSSQASSWTDMFISFALFAWVSLSPWLATALGAVAGGIVNCLMTYKFTFHAGNCPWRAVVVKFALVWVGSLLLNSFGTEFCYHMLQRMTWLEELGFKPDGYFATARLGVSLIVSIAWNFLLQRYFVYRNNAFDPYAIRFMNWLTFKHSK